MKWIYGLRKRKGKEFNYYFNLEFEGEYLNGLINGKGKEYYNNKLIFEGEYLNGEKWNGTIKIFDSNKILEFEGEYLNGEKNRKGKEYDYNGKLIFEGEYLNGEKKSSK